MAKADLDGAKETYPSWAMDDAGWEAFFETPEGFNAFGRLLGDIYQRAKIEEERASGVKRLGRKPRVATSLDEVIATVFPEQFSTDPFPEAMAALLNGRSQRQFALKCGMNQSTLSRFLSGASHPDVYTLQKLAEAAKVPPSYFVEWRAQYVGQLFTKLLTDFPHLGVKAIKTLRSFT